MWLCVQETAQCEGGGLDGEEVGGWWGMGEEKKNTWEEDRQSSFIFIFPKKETSDRDADTIEIWCEATRI